MADRPERAAFIPDSVRMPPETISGIALRRGAGCGRRVCVWARTRVCVTEGVRTGRPSDQLALPETILCLACTGERREQTSGGKPSLAQTTPSDIVSAFNPHFLMTQNRDLHTNRTGKLNEESLAFPRGCGQFHVLHHGRVLVAAQKHGGGIVW